MAIAVNLSNHIVTEARRVAPTLNRSVSEQIECWASIGKIAEENPDLSYNFIKDILIAKAELEDKEITPYQVG